MIFNQWIKNDISDEQARSLGIYHTRGKLKIAGKDGELSPFEVHSVRPVRRSGPDGQLQLAIVAELIQSWRSVDEYRYRGGSTVIIDPDRRQIRYVIRKRVGHAGRVADQQSYRMALADATPRSNYYADDQTTTESKEPFAMLHHA